MVVVAAEPLQAQALSSLLTRAARADATPVQSLDDVPQALADGSHAAIVWHTETAEQAGLEALADIRRTHGDVSICILAKRVEPAPLSDLLATAPGSIAVLLRDNNPDVRDLISTVRQVVRGRVVLGARLMEEVLSAPAARRDRFDELSDREREVLELLSLGLRNREIARRISRSEKLVEKHVQHVFAKLGLDPGRRARIDRRVAAARMYLMSSGGAADGAGHNGGPP